MSALACPYAIMICTIISKPRAYRLLVQASLALMLSMLEMVPFPDPSLGFSMLHAGILGTKLVRNKLKKPEYKVALHTSTVLL